MAGEWIKMRNNLWDDPRVARLCDLTGKPEAMIIGGLYWLWSSADEHTEIGHMPGLSVASIDRKTGCKGLGAGLVEVGWIVDTPGGITISSFEEHNGATAKKRANTAKRANNHRGRNGASVTEPEKSNAVSVTPALRERYLELEEEKKKEIQERADSVSRPSRAPDGADELPPPTPARLACRAMRSAGLAAVNPGDPRLLALLAQGATVAEFEGLAAEAAAGGKSFAWVLVALQGRRAEAAAITLAPAIDSAEVGRSRIAETQAMLDRQRAESAAAVPMPDHLKRKVVA